VIKSETAGLDWKPLRMAASAADPAAAAAPRTQAGGAGDAMPSERLPGIPIKAPATPRPAAPPLPVKPPPPSH